MAASFVQGTFASESGNATPLPTPALGNPTVSGNFLACGVSFDSGTLNTVTGITDNKGNTWQKIDELDGACLVSLWVAYNIVGGSGHTLNIAYNDAVGSAISAVVQEFSGVATSAAFDKVTHAQGTSTAPSSGASAATTQADELVIGLVAYDGALTTPSLGSGYSNLGQAGLANASCAMESKIVAATGAQTATFGLAASRDWAAIVATFKAAAGGGGGGGGSAAARTGFLPFFG